VRIAMAGEAVSDPPVSNQGSPGTSRATESWDFTITQATTFTMTVRLVTNVGISPIQAGPSYSLNGGGIQLTVGTLDASSGIYRSFSSPVTQTDNFAGTLAPGGYNVHMSGLVSNLDSPSSGSFSYTLTLALGSRCATADFNHDGNIGTDADIESFFACLGGSCCPLCATADFNGDGNVGTDADIEAFFRVLGGGSC